MKTRREIDISRREISGTTAGRIGRPKRRDHAYDYRAVPVDYAIPQAFLTWVSSPPRHSDAS